MGNDLLVIAEWRSGALGMPSGVLPSLVGSCAPANETAWHAPFLANSLTVCNVAMPYMSTQLALPVQGRHCGVVI